MKGGREREAVKCFKSLFSDKKKNKDIPRLLEHADCFPNNDATNAHEFGLNPTRESLTKKLSDECRELDPGEAYVFSQLIKGLVYFLDSIVVKSEREAKEKQELKKAKEKAAKEKAKQKLKSRLDAGTKTDIWVLPHEVVL